MISVIRLKDLLASNTAFARKIVSVFECPGSPTDGAFLRHDAIHAEISNDARTYLSVDTERDLITGFFTVKASDGCREDRPSYTIWHIACG